MSQAHDIQEMSLDTASVLCFSPQSQPKHYLRKANSAYGRMFEQFLVSVDTITEITIWRLMFYEVRFISLYEKRRGECNESPLSLSLSLFAVWMFFSLALDTSLSGVTRGFHLGRALPL